MSHKNRAFPEKLAKLFSAAVFRSLAGPAAGWNIRQIIEDSGSTGLGRRMRLKRVFDRAYDHLMQSYRSEYFYKNTLTNTILLEKHSLDEGPHSARLLTEFWAGEARVDLGVVNGTSTAYEVKSDLDKLDRLSNQLGWYSKVFDKTFVVTSENMLAPIANMIPAHVGVMVLDSDGLLVERIPAESNKARVDTRAVFQSMRGLEILDFCVSRYGIDPKISNVLRLEACWNVFSQLSPEQAHDVMVSVLRKRRIHPAQRALIDAAPRSLKHHAISRSMNVGYYPSIVESFEAVV